MTIGIIKEPKGESRVLMLAETVKALTSSGITVHVETGAGLFAFQSDESYTAAGAAIVSRTEAFSSDIVLAVHPPLGELKLLKPGTILSSVIPVNPETVSALQEAKVTAFSLDLVPRITRAQTMDILSSMATVSGYKAVLEAAFLSPSFFPMFMSAAGTIKPARVLILGAGVAGLQAISVARKLGAIVEVFDVRSAVKTEAESLGAKFIEVEGAREEQSAGGYAVEQSEEYKNKQKQLIHDHAVRSNIIICTALIPGRKAPLLVSKNTVQQMMPGSVIIDLAASSGGNCELTKDHEIVVAHGVTIAGRSAYPSQTPVDASRMMGRNMLNFIKSLISPEKQIKLNFDDEIIHSACVVHNGEIISERVKQLLKM